MAQEKEKKNKKYRFETYAFITIVKCMMWSWTALVAFLTVMLLGEGKGIPDIRRMIELIGSWLLAVCGIGVLYCSKEMSFIEISEKGMRQRSRGGYTFQFYSWEEIREIGYGTSRTRGGDMVEYIYAANRRLSVLERNDILHTKGIIRMVPTPALKEALDLYWKKPVKAPEGWERGGGFKMGKALFTTAPPDEHRLTSEEAKFPQEIQIQVRQTDEYEMEAGEPVGNLYVELISAYLDQSLYRLNAVTDEQGCVKFTREQVQAKLDEQREKTGWAPEIDRLRDKIYVTLWDERKGKGAELQEEAGTFTERDGIWDRIRMTIMEEQKGTRMAMMPEGSPFTEEERAIFARTDNLRYDERYDQPYSVDRRDQDEQGILRGVMPVYPHDEDGEQCL